MTAVHGPTHVVGIGASAGGLESLERLLPALAPDTGMAFIIVQHLSAEHDSLMAELLAKRTPMPILVASDGVVLEANVVYVNPPTHNVEVRDGTILLTDRMDLHERRPNFAVDQLFRSLALHLQERAIGVILSGTGSDGAHGSLAIHSGGGIVVVEDPSEAKFDGMPQSTIERGAASLTCKAEEIPKALHDLLGNIERLELPQSDLERVISLVSRHVGVDFHSYKRGTVERRIARRRAATRCESMAEYSELVEGSAEECERLGQDLLVGVTAFFRDRAVHERLEPLLVDLVNEVVDRGDEVLRVWVSACSTGEEAYTIAMGCLEAIEAAQVNVGLKLFATDINTDALAHAGRGRYPVSAKAELPDGLAAKYFTIDPDALVAKQRLRENVVFARHDVLRDPPFTRLDLLCCRNLLIYFDADAQRRATQVFRFGLRPGGLLLLGQSEGLSASEAFSVVDEEARVFSMRRGGRNRRNREPAVPPIRRRAVTPPGDQPAAPASPSPRSRDPGLRLLERTLEQLGMPVLVLNAAGELAYAFGDIAQALRVPAGRAAWKAADLFPADSAAVITSAVLQAIAQREPVRVERFTVPVGEGQYRGSLRAVPLEVHEDGTGSVALFFDTAWEPTAASPITVDDAVRRRIQQLEAELARRTGELRRFEEQLDTSTEELQATNEELVSSNEELQSTNEELQSLNEELHTINAELQYKVEELSLLSTDLENLLHAVQGGLLFLDNEGMIRRYNAAMLDVLPLVQHDIGRPIGDIANTLVDVDLGHEVRRVLQTQLGYEREVRARSGRTLALSIQPFMKNEGGHEGVLLTLNDVSALTESIERLHGYLRTIDQTPFPTALSSPTEGIQLANAALCECLGVQASALLGQPLSMLLHPDCAPAALAATERFDASAPWHGPLLLHASDGSRVKVDGSIFAVLGTTGTAEVLTLTCQLNPSGEAAAER